MRIKLIGGPCDGQWATVQGVLFAEREITVVRPNLNSSTWERDWKHQDIPPLDDRDWETHQYVLDAIMGPDADGTIRQTWFARPATISTAEAIRKVIQNHG